MQRSLRTALPCATALALLSALACTGEAEKTEKAAPPATVQHPVTEAELTTVRLTGEAVRRLGIETAAVESASVAPTRTVGGEVVVPPGQALTVSAPVAGTVFAPAGGAIPGAGTRVAARQPLMRLIALPADRDLLRTGQDLTIAEARLRQAQAETDRVAKLYADRLVSARDNESAQADLAAARAAHDAASAQQRLVRGGAPGDASGLTSLVIASPGAGVIRTLSAAAGQSVAAGAPLAEIVRLDRLWVRVPLYAGDASRITRGAAATVHGLGGAGSGPVLRALPVAAPPSADAAAASVDLFYEVRGGSALRPGERVGVTLPIAGAAGATGAGQGLVV
ncbi:MAG: HlyD family efflux transporter periplasmic adaptor subunit, partial [Gemmatimonadaceae bacterium]